MAAAVPAPPIVEGSIAAAPLPSAATDAVSSAPQLQTLDEPVVTTIARDLKMVARKLKVVLLPTTAAAGELASPLPGGGGPSATSGSQVTLKVLREWDLWGPLLLCLALSIILSLNAPTGQTSLVFASVFVTIWAGAAIVTVNAKLLGGKMCEAC
jgi:hypothetical protein